MVKSFGAALNCIDGRVQMPVLDWMKAHFGCDYVDVITEPGMDKVLSHGSAEEKRRIMNKLIISINAHNSKSVAIVGHYDCAANPVNDYEHLRDIAMSVNTIKSWNLPLIVSGLWVDEKCQVHVVCM
jgi:carbonic anhydrase